MRRGALLILALLAGCAQPSPAPNAASAEVAGAGPRREPPTRVSALLNQDTAAIEAALGPPTLRRAEGKGEVWLYADSTGCSLDVVFLPGGGGLTVVHATTRTPTTISEAACLRLISDPK